MRRDITLDGDHPSLDDFDLSGFFDVTDISVVISDAQAEDMPIIYVNRAFETTTGYSRSFAIGRNCRFMQGEDTNAESVGRIRVALDRGQSITEVLTNYRPDGSAFLNELNLTPIRNKKDVIVFYVGLQNILSENISEKISREKERKLMTSIQRHITSHLDVIMDISSLEGDAGADETPSSKEDFLRRVSSLDVLYRDIGTHLSDDDLLDLGAYVSHIASICATEHARFGIRVNIMTDSVIAPMDYAVRIGLLLQEILENALTHAFEGRDVGFVEVVLRKDGGNLSLSVTDDGTGFTQETIWPDQGRYGASVARRLAYLTRSQIEFETSEHGTVIEIVSPLAKNGVPL